ncbi:MAG: DUF3500 domain-containing protein [Planctomycetales bacterium]
MNSRRFLVLTLALGLMVGVGASALFQKTSAPAMTTAAKAFLKSLPKEQRKAASFAYDHPNRVGWHFIPKPFEGKAARKGVTLKSMSKECRKAAHELLRTGLSEAGYTETVKVMSLEGILAKIEGPVPDRAWTRDPEMYYFTVYGKPGKGRWGWRCEGHHLSLNFVVEGDQLVSATPAFYGSNPADVPEGPHKGLRVLAKREDLALELFNSMDPAQQKIVLQAKEAPRDLRGGGVAQPETTAAVGLSAKKMTKDQQKVLRMLLESYAQTMASDVSEKWLKAAGSGFEDIHFAWWGASQRGEGVYYRVQGPLFLIEYANTQNGANHVHSYWRDLKGDFAVPLANK